MKKILLLSCLFSLIALVSQAEPKHYPSTISEVTVYLQGAMVKRTAQVKLVPGTNEIVLDGLSNYLDINSVRLESNSNITILSVNAATNYLKPVEPSSLDIQLQYSWDTTNNRLSKIQNEIAALDEEMDMLKANYRLNNGPNTSYIDALDNLADFYQKRVRDVLSELNTWHKRETDYLVKQNAIQAQKNEIYAKNSHPYGEITFIASSNGYTDANFTFTYYVSNAYWTPTYNMRAENTASNINLDYDAEVSQTTGEDWKNVKLILSTGNPSVSGIKPKMPVATLGYYDPATWAFGDNNSIRGNRAKASFRNLDNSTNQAEISHEYTIQSKSQEDAKRDDSMKKLTYASDYTNLNKNVLATNFEINLKYDILSDGIVKHVRIQQYSLPSHFEYAALPMATTDAFLEAAITGWEEYNLLPGEVNIFLESGFVGKSYIDPSTTKDTLMVSFGKDRKINIKRIRVKNFTKNQFLGSNKVQSFGFATNVRNTKDVPVDIKIEDQIPISSQKDIVVELLESSGATLDKGTGKLTWQVTLQPNEEKTVKFEYTVKYPKGKMVSGL